MTGDQVLKSRVDRLEAMLRQVPAFVGLVDRDMTLVEYNFTPIDGVVLDRADMIGKRVRNLHWWNELPELGELVETNIRAAFGGDLRTMEIPNIHADGRPSTSEMRFEPLADNGDDPAPYVLVTGIDVTAVVAEREYRAMLLREVNHRVKNSLQIVSSILNLEASASETAASRERFKAASERVYAVANVHDLIYRIDSFDSIPFRSYLSDLCAALERSCRDERRAITIACDGPDIDVATNHAITLALISNELITNAIKYAFSDRNSGRINVQIERAGGSVRLIVSDDGQGVQSEKPASSTGLGSKLIGVLARQVGGVVETSSSEGGFRAMVTFPANDDKAGALKEAFEEASAAE